MATDEDIQHLFELRDATKKRLHEYQLQRTLYGISAPAHIAIEIKQAEKDIALLEAQLQTVQPSADVVEALGPVNTQTLLLDWRQKQLVERVESGFREMLSRFTQIAEQVVQDRTVSDQRYEQEVKIRAERQKEHDERLTTMETGIDVNTEQVKQLFRRINVARWLLIGLLVTVGAALIWYQWQYGVVIQVIILVLLVALGTLYLAYVLRDRHPK